MDITRQDSERSISSFEDRVNRFLEYLWSTHWEDSGAPWTDLGLIFDVYDKKGYAVIQAQLPGLKKEDVQVDIRGRVLTLKARQQREGETVTGGFNYKERFNATFKRSITLPPAVDPRSVEANFSEGILKIMIPKPRIKEDAQTRKISID